MQKKLKKQKIYFILEYQVTILSGSYQVGTWKKKKKEVTLSCFPWLTWLICGHRPDPLALE